MERVIKLRPKIILNIRDTHVRPVILRLSYTGNHNTMEYEVDALNVVQTGPNHDRYLNLISIALLNILMQVDVAHWTFAIFFQSTSVFVTHWNFF